MSKDVMYEQIYLCSGDFEAEALARDVGKFFKVKSVKLTDDPCLLRKVLSTQGKSCLVVLDAIQSQMDVKNLLHALYIDGYTLAFLDDESGDNGFLVSAYNPSFVRVYKKADVFKSKAVKPVGTGRTIEIPEEEHPWEALKKTLEDKTRSFSFSLADDCGELDEVEGVMPKLNKGNGFSLLPPKSPRQTDSRHRGRSIAFCSGRGGAGKTTLTSLGGYLTASWGFKVCLLDLDLFCGNAYMYFGAPSIPSLNCVKDVATSEYFYKDYIQKVSDLQELYLLGPLDHPEEAELVMPYYDLIVNKLLESFDLVLIDMPSTWSEQDVRVLRLVDRMIVVADERASSVTSMIRTMNLANRLGIARAKMIRLINRCDAYGYDQQFIKKAEEGSYCPHTYYVEDGGRQVAEKLSAGRVEELMRCKNRLVNTWSEDLAKILQEMGIALKGKNLKSEQGGIFSTLFPFSKNNVTHVGG